MNNTLCKKNQITFLKNYLNWDQINNIEFTYHGIPRAAVHFKNGYTLSIVTELLQKGSFECAVLFNDRMIPFDFDNEGEDTTRYQPPEKIQEIIKQVSVWERSIPQKTEKNNEKSKMP